MTAGTDQASPETAKILYFAYGSNLSSERIRMNNKSAVFKAVGLLKGYRLEFAHKSVRWHGFSANIIPDSNSHVYGVIWELQETDLPHLDKQEGVEIGIYERIQVQLEVEGESDPVSTLCYQLTHATRQKAILENEEHLLQPSKVYKNVIIRGAREHKLPANYIAFLENLKDNGYDGVVDLKIPD